jgi:hypothetical protein
LDQPGQWLALDVAVRALLLATWYLAAMFVESLRGEVGLIWFFIICIGAIGFGIAIFQIVAAVKQAPRSAWRYLFVVKSLTLVFLYGMVFLTSPVFSGVPEIVVAITFLVLYFLLIALQLYGMYSDRRYKRPRHWTHWTGLVAHLGSNLAIALFGGLTFLAVLFGRL